MNTAIKAGTNFNSKYGKKLTDIAIKTGKDFVMIAGKKEFINQLKQLEISSVIKLLTKLLK